jgi:hypothetical protein
VEGGERLSELVEFPLAKPRTVLAKPRSKVSCQVGMRVWRCCAAGGGMTRHPGTGAAQQPAVAVREPVENRAAKRKSVCAGFCPATAG